jgi:hypothetical protein
MAMELQPHQKRVVDEKTELGEKLFKLMEFLKTPTFERLDIAEKDRLYRQQIAMRTYAGILTERIAAF